MRYLAASLVSIALLVGCGGGGDKTTTLACPKGEVVIFNQVATLHPSDGSDVESADLSWIGDHSSIVSFYIENGCER